MNVEEEILLECELILMNVHYDLVRWHEELEQARYAAHLDGIIEWQFAKPVDELKKIVPLVTYASGERLEIGIARVDLVTGNIEASIDDSYDRRYLEAGPPGAYSIGYDVDKRQVRVKPVPYDRRKINPFFKEDQDADRPEDHPAGGGRPNRFPQLRRRRDEVQPSWGEELRAAPGPRDGGADGEGSLAGEVPPAP